jgi:hypothetical protein
MWQDQEQAAAMDGAKECPATAGNGDLRLLQFDRIVREAHVEKIMAPRRTNFDDQFRIRRLDPAL